MSTTQATPEIHRRRWPGAKPKRKFDLMLRLLSIVSEEVLKTLKRPKRILGILKKDKRRAYLDEIQFKRKDRELWVDEFDRKLKRRFYQTSEDYVRHQRSKLARFDLSTYDIKYRAALRERLQKNQLLQQGMTVLCLAARLGTEVKSFFDLGYFAVGIDLNPGRDNRYVLLGDFHDIQFPSNSVDAIFTNSLDHVFDMRRVIDEIKRLLKAEGLLIVEAARGTEEGLSPGFHESFSWSKIDDLVGLFESSGFKLIHRSSFDYPWNGEQLSFEKEK